MTGIIEPHEVKEEKTNKIPAKLEISDFRIDVWKAKRAALHLKESKLFRDKYFVAEVLYNSANGVIYKGNLQILKF